MEVGDLVTLWKHNQVLVACGQVWWLYGQDLVVALASTVKFWWSSGVCLQCGGVSQQQTQEPPQEVLVVVIASLVVIWSLWWSFGQK